MLKHRVAAARGFTLIELLLVVAIIALLVGILLPALGNARKAARTGVCQSNMRQQGVAMHTYAADFKERLYSFSWQKNQSLSNFGDLNGATSDVDAACNQMVDIVRRLGDRTQAETPKFTAGSFFPYLRYSHLVLQDYLGTRLPDPTVACPEDQDQKRWGLDPRGYDQGKYQPNYGTGGINWRWPYRSNYWITVGAFDKNVVGQRARPADYGHLFVTTGPTVKYGNRTMSEISFPGSKVFSYEQYGRHTNQAFDYRTYFGLDTSKIVVQMFDNSVALRNSKDANRGNANPNVPMGTVSTTAYNADGTTPDPRAPNGSILSYVRFQYTRGGLKGIDFGGKEPTVTTGY